MAKGCSLAFTLTNCSSYLFIWVRPLQFFQCAASGLSSVRRRMEITALKKDRNEFLAEMSLSEWKSRGEIFFTAMIRDVTEIRAAEAQLAFSEERYRTVVNNTPSSIVLFDETGVIYANPSAVKLIGARTEQELLGRSQFDFLHPDYVESAKKLVDEMFQTMKPAPVMEQKLRRLDGTFVDVEVIDATACWLKWHATPSLRSISRLAH